MLTSRGKTITKTNENAEDFNEITVIRIVYLDKNVMQSVVDKIRTN